MGVGSSRPHTIPLVSVFEKEYAEVRGLLTDILGEDDLFRNRKYNMFLKGRCDEMTMIARKRLERHPKFEVQSLRDDLYVVPNDELNETKKSMCNAISMHYTRILKLFFVVKYIYDVETHGDYSIAGILLRNVQMRDGLIETRYCGTAQEELGSFDKGVDFSKLSGFNVFVNDFLNVHERGVFLGHLRELLQKGDMRYLRRWICKDFLVPKARYAQIYRQPVTCPKAGGGRARTGGNVESSIFVKVAERNPILSWQLCASPKTFVSKENPRIMKAIKHMQARYRANIEQVGSALGRLIERSADGGVVNLRSITNTELTEIENAVKRAVVEFFVESFVNFRHVLNETEKSSINRNA